MSYSNSSLVTQTKLSTKFNPRTGPITGITIHMNAGVCSVASLLDFASKTTRSMSFNYCIGDNEVGMCVEEANRAWTSSSRSNDMRCVTIEVINSSIGGEWPISDESMTTLIKLCADICIRNNIPKLYYNGTTSATLTRHCMFANTSCPGPYIKNHTDYICAEVNKLIVEHNSGSGGQATDEGVKPSVTPTPQPSTPETSTKPSIRYNVYTNKRWLPVVDTNSSTSYAGNQNQCVSGLSAVSDIGKIKYRVHQISGDRWLPWVVQNTDYAGNFGKNIDMVQMTLLDAPGYKVQYRASVNGNKGWNSWITEYNNTNSSGYAGIKRKPIDAIQIQVVKA